MPDRWNGKRKRHVGMILYFVVAFCAVCVLFRVADSLVGRFMPISPWPPLGLNNQSSHEWTIQLHDFEYTARTNSIGLREAEIPPKNKDSLRILIIGDSYVYGWGVNHEDTWVEKLKILLTNAGYPVEVINGGMPGNGPLEYAERAEYLIPDLEPDLVLVSILEGGDLVETPHEIRWCPNLITLIKDWLNRAPRPVDPILVTTAEMIHTSYLGDVPKELQLMNREQRARFDMLDTIVKQCFFDGRLNLGMVRDAVSSPDHYVLPSKEHSRVMVQKTGVLGMTMLRIRRIATQYGASVFGIVMPEGPYVNREALKNWKRLGYEMPAELYGSEGPEHVIHAACEKTGIGYFNLCPAFREHGDEPGLFFELDTHMSPAGHTLFANALFPLLTKELPQDFLDASKKQKAQ